MIKRIIQYSSLSRYLTIGGMAFGVDYGVLLLTYYVFSLPLGVATSLGYATGFAVSFISNRNWVFGDAGKDKHLARQSIEYFALVIFNYCFTVVGVRLLNEHNVKPYIGKVLVMALIVCWNYLLFKKVIFVAKNGKTHTSPPKPEA
jgi:putative flippase GtrA